MASKRNIEVPGESTSTDDAAPEVASADTPAAIPTPPNDGSEDQAPALPLGVDPTTGLPVDTSAPLFSAEEAASKPWIKSQPETEAVATPAVSDDEIAKARALLEAAGLTVASPAAPVDASKPDPNKPVDWSHLNYSFDPKRELPKDDPTANLPAAESIDTSKIPYGRSVLTKSGWLVSTAPAPDSMRK